MFYGDEAFDQEMDRRMLLRSGGGGASQLAVGGGWGQMVDRMIFGVLFVFWIGVNMYYASRAGYFDNLRKSMDNGRSKLAAQFSPQSSSPPASGYTNVEA